jgi:uncharacterized protein with PIN domain
MSKKFIYEEVKQFVEADGTKLLSLEYINANTPLDFICSKGYTYSNTFGNFKHKGSRCPLCAGLAKLSYEEVKAYVEADGTKLLSLEYISSKTPLDFMCPKDHTYSNNFSHFKNRGQRCPICAGVAKYTFEEVKEFVEADGTTLCSTEYVNNCTKMNFLCPKGHKYSMIFSDFKNGGSRCRICSGGPVSKISQVWLDALNILNLKREYPVCVGKRSFSVDGYNPLTRTIYEFLGNYWHGNLGIYDPDDINPTSKKSYGQLNRETFERFAVLEAAGYTVKYVWEHDYHQGKTFSNDKS